MSPRRLDLRILCTSGAAIKSTLDSWPTLPLVISYGWGRRLKNIPRNVIDALRHPDRLCKIDLNVTSSMTGPIVKVIQKPCQVLEGIRITVNDTQGPSILVRNGFLGGSAPRLREIKLDGIAFPFSAIRQVLLSTNSLVQLNLSKIPNDVYFSPDDLITALSTLVQLKWLTVGFYSPDSRPPPSMTRPRHQRTSLPSLVFLGFYGTSEYLEEFVARIELHALSTLRIKFFNDIVFEIPQFCEFMTRLNQPRSPTSASMKLNSGIVGVDFLDKKTNLGNEYSTHYALDYALETSCIPFDWKLSFLTQIASQLSPLLSSVYELTILGCSILKVPTGEEAADSTQWLELFQPFTHVTKVTVWETKVVQSIMQALLMEEAAGVLPELTTLHLSGYQHTPSVAKAAEQFVATRSLSGRAVHLIN